MNIECCEDCLGISLTGFDVADITQGICPKYTRDLEIFCWKKGIEIPKPVVKPVKSAYKRGGCDGEKF